MVYKIATSVMLMFMYLSSFAQTYNTLEKNLQQHIGFLASDSLHGRRTGTEDEKKAADYIISQFKSDHLQPMGDKGGWKQAFKYTVGRVVSESSNMSIDINYGDRATNHIYLKANKDFEALFFSATGIIAGKTINVGYGLQNKEAKRDDYEGKAVKGKVVVLKPGSDDLNPHSTLNENSDAYSKCSIAQEKGATAVVFIGSHSSDLIHLKYEISENLKIPVVVLLNDTTLKDGCEVKANIETEDIIKTGYNVLGYMDNHSTNTVVIGAHYDHLGYGEDGNSLYRGEPAIHNGADDNASGTAAVLEMARLIPQGFDKHNNYLFVCFSGEELGLYGSKYLAHHLPIDSSHINYMINMDMLGRYREEKGIEVGGLGTSPAFDKLKSDFDKSGLKIHESKSGMGPSDFTSFYLANHPVIYFFTGTHEDYHKPSDKADRINYTQEAGIIDHLIMPIIHTLDGEGKVAFTQTKDYDKQNDVPRFKVRMGIIPDYMFEGSGVRVDGVTPGNPAEKAGLKTGDIVVQMDELSIGDLQSYMKALGTFKAGQTVNVKVRRGKDEVTTKVTF